MADQHLKVDERQFDRIVGALKHPSSDGGRLDNVLKLLRVLAIVGAGLWAVFGYLSYRQDWEELSLQREQLAVELATLSATNQRGQNALQELTLQKSADSRFRLDASLDVTEQREPVEDVGNYQADLSFSITSLTDKEFEVSYVVIEYFLGNVPQARSSERIIPVNLPPNIYNDPEHGPVRWSKLGDQAYYLGSSDWLKKGGSLPQGYEWSPSGGGTASLRSGESSSFTYNYLVSARADEWVGFVINLAVDGGRDSKNLWHIVRTRFLGHSSERVLVE